MDAATKNIMEECSKGSEEGRLTFPQVVMKLMELGVERYTVDFMRHEKIFYMPNGDSLLVSSAIFDAPLANSFAASSVDAAVRASQAGQINYLEFCRRVMAAGCVGYLVSIKGRRAVYSGRTGESHVEPFPGTK